MSQALREKLEASAQSLGFVQIGLDPSRTGVQHACKLSRDAGIDQHADEQQERDQHNKVGVVQAEHACAVAAGSQNRNDASQSKK